ncbi:heavy metal-binding domain-containing protein [Methanotrichaceae archaeon Mx]|uniref:Heavy metal-binding domain-containing protein n=1 Tax=Candidatus Methanocrinis natronophilus TaxID=3033396 RepID=A0ABT5X7Y4_9EURY|nr:heavy metal-binding domain-containing protein [Candidatus Methanocrinis natronophilus]MDF0590800.1 heavy metal-binding domain-containing protein [Candidatus Methanocrinis natronophilus]
MTSTTPTVEGRRIVKYLGIVSWEAFLGANAVLSVDLDYETLGQNGGMLMVSASGTAGLIDGTAP